MSRKTLFALAWLAIVAVAGLSLGVKAYHLHLDTEFAESFIKVQYDFNVIAAKPDLKANVLKDVEIARNELAAARLSQQQNDRGDAFNHLQVAAINVIIAKHDGSVPVDAVKPELQNYGLDF